MEVFSKCPSKFYMFFCKCSENFISGITCKSNQVAKISLFSNALGVEDENKNKAAVKARHLSDLSKNVYFSRITRNAYKELA